MDFLTEEPLAEEIYDTIYNADKFILILSPFIQLDDYFKNEVFKTHLNNSQVHIIIGFGKNETDISKSFKSQDIEYFTQFPNITIVYIPNLHGKYYGNEKKAVITSMNLIDYSFKNNIELGVSVERKLLANNAFFDTSMDKCFSIIENGGYTVFVKRPKYKKKFLIGKDYVGSETELDIIQDLSQGKNITKISPSEFLNEKFVNSEFKTERVKREELSEEEYNNSTSVQQDGHCIRCKKSIPLDLEKPLCYSCYEIWFEYSNPNFKEKYCISCGGKHSTSLSKPACYSCYKKLE